MSVLELVRKQKIVVMLGAGGVGKTTSAIALALLAAREGRRVALLSIDPAKRLAAALGIPLSNELRPLQFPPELKIAGSVEAAMLDQKAVFDAMVRRHAPSSSIAERILAHPTYKAASSNMSGPLEYMALAKLEDLASDSKYDLVVLDTPPDAHALDFLARPNILAGFMENKVMNWLIKPFVLGSKLGMGRIFNAGEKLMGGLAKIAGVSALHTLADFLVLLQDVIEGFHRSGERIVSLLRRDDTSFVLVTIPNKAAIRSAASLAKELNNLNYTCEMVLFNRCLPEAVAADLKTRDEKALNEHPELLRLARRLRGENTVKALLTEEMSAYSQRPPALVTIADQNHDLGSLQSLIQFAEKLI